MIRATFLLGFAIFAFAACDRGPLQAPVVVYAVGNDEAELTEQFAEFTDDTRIPVTLMFSKSSKNADLVINNNGSPPADVLISNNVADNWPARTCGAARGTCGLSLV